MATVPANKNTLMAMKSDIFWWFCYFMTQCYQENRQYDKQTREEQ
jgi:hypothetical protein